MLHRFGRRAAIATACSIVLVTVAGTALVGGPASVRPLRGASNRISSDTVWSPVARALVVEDLGERVPAARADASADREVVRVALIVLVGGVLVVGVATRRVDDVAVALLAGVAVYLVLGTYVLPWYAGWGVALLALRVRSRWVPAVLAYA